jgi:hypothetical protein
VFLVVEGVVWLCPYNCCLACFSRCCPAKEGRTTVQIWHDFLGSRFLLAAKCNFVVDILS